MKIKISPLGLGLWFLAALLATAVSPSPAATLLLAPVAVEPAAVKAVAKAVAAAVAAAAVVVVAE